MKLKIITISIILLCTIAVVTHYNQKVNKKMLTNLSLANIEAPWQALMKAQTRKVYPHLKKLQNIFTMIKED